MKGFFSVSIKGEKNHFVGFSADLTAGTRISLGSALNRGARRIQAMWVLVVLFLFPSRVVEKQGRFCPKAPDHSESHLVQVQVPLVGGSAASSIKENSTRCIAWVLSPLLGSMSNSQSYLPFEKTRPLVDG